MRLTRHLAALQELGIAPSTHRTYQAGWNHFTGFCRLYDITPAPATETTLRYYCVHAYRSISHASILVYLAAIRYQHLQLGYRDPLVDKPLLSYLCKGIRRHQGNQGRERLPLTSALLSTLQHLLRQSDSIATHDKRVVWAAVTLGFHAFLRGGEFTTTTSHRYNPNRHLLRRDLTLQSDKIILTVKASKTDPYSTTCTLPVAATNTSTCPVRAMRKFLNSTHHSSHLPLFILHSGDFLTKAHLTSVIRTLLQASGLTPAQAKKYSSHSLRIGAATEAAAAGLPTWLIQAAGRWKSSAYQRYIRTPKKALLRVAPALAGQADS